MAGLPNPASRLPKLNACLPTYTAGLPNPAMGLPNHTPFLPLKKGAPIFFEKT
jgi:hypothetical protein